MLYLTRNLYAVLCLLILTSCIQGKNINIEKEIIQFINTHCDSSQKCTIDLKQLTPFQWDKAYIFNNVSEQFIQEKLGIPYTLYQDIGVKIIFVQGAQIAQYQEFFPYPESNQPVRLSFEFTSEQDPNEVFNYYLLTPDNAALKIVQYEYRNHETDKNVVYEIQPTNRKQLQK